MGSHTAFRRWDVLKKALREHSKIHDLQRLPCNGVMMHPKQKSAASDFAGSTSCISSEIVVHNPCTVCLHKGSCFEQCNIV